MSRYHVRCSNRHCRARQVLPKHPDAYQRPRKCWSCGRAKWTIDPYMTKRNTRAMGCMCSGYMWGGMMSGAMHRRGSLHCWFNADGTPRVMEKKVNRDIEPAELAWLTELVETPAAAQAEAIHRFAAAQTEMRDRFAAAALQGMLASNGADWDIGPDKAFTARQCYEYADAMMKARAA